MRRFFYKVTYVDNEDICVSIKNDQYSFSSFDIFSFKREEPIINQLFSFQVKLIYGGLLCTP